MKHFDLLLYPFFDQGFELYEPIELLILILQNTNPGVVREIIIEGDII
jgi:hypothetical protein